MYLSCHVPNKNVRLYFSIDAIGAHIDSFDKETTKFSIYSIWNSLWNVLPCCYAICRSISLYLTLLFCGCFWCFEYLNVLFYCCTFSCSLSWKRIWIFYIVDSLCVFFSPLCYSVESLQFKLLYILLLLLLFHLPNLSTVYYCLACTFIDRKTTTWITQQCSRKKTTTIKHYS